MREEAPCSHFTSTGCEHVTVKGLCLGGVSLENAHILPASPLLPLQRVGVIHFVC